MKVATLRQGARTANTLAREMSASGARLVGLPIPLPVSGTISPLGSTTQSAAFRAALECAPGADQPDPANVADAKLVAIRVGSIS